MIALLSAEGRAALRAVAGRSVLYAFDFDGTLAKISPDRGGVTLSPSMHEWLRELAARAPCAIVSGRALSDLTLRVNGAVPYLIGNHGVESPLTPAATLHAAERVCLGWMNHVAGDLAGPLTDAGAEVEDKRYTLTVHYRGPDEAVTAERVQGLLRTHLTPVPRLIVGKASVNVVPPGSPMKGDAALALMRHLQRDGLFFIGDDETDEAVFGLEDGLLMGVRVGRPPHSRAGYYLTHQGESEAVIRLLVHRLDRAPHGTGPHRSDDPEGLRRGTGGNAAPASA
jgi:trehalose 6-phosphate phosphatase